MGALNSNVLQGPAAAILAYCGASILMTVTNKMILSSYAFHMNFLVLAVQNGVTVLLLELFTSMGWVSHRPFRQEEARRWFVVSLAMVGMIYTGSKALQYMAIPLFTVFKNLSIIMIAYGEMLWFGGSNVSGMTFSAFALMVLSSLIAGWSDISQGNVFKDDTANPFVAYGWMIINCLSSAFFALFVRSKIREVGFTDFDTVFYNNLLSLPVLLGFSFLLEQRQFADFLSTYTGDGSSADQFWGLVGALVVSSVSAFAISYGTSWCVRVTSSTTYSMAGALNKLPIAIAGMTFFNDPITTLGVFGVLLAFAAGVIYTYSKNLEKMQLQKTQYSVLPTSSASSTSGFETPKIKLGSFVGVNNSSRDAREF